MKIERFRLRFNSDISIFEMLTYLIFCFEPHVHSISRLGFTWLFSDFFFHSGGSCALLALLLQNSKSCADFLMLALILQNSKSCADFLILDLYSLLLPWLLAVFNRVLYFIQVLSSLKRCCISYQLRGQHLLASINTPLT